ncbi:MAG: ATP--guanido phosphotransferase [Ruminococcaceae bacterium]|nr:ATP--guanido phosphotransferase [Oscillospiraceae bacterium]
MNNFLFNQSGPDRDVVFSSRVRFARNVKDYPFSDRIDLPSQKELEQKILALYDSEEFTVLPFEGLGAAEALSYAEKLLVSPEFAAAKGPHTLVLNEKECLSVMVCEEDHIRLQCLKNGFALDEAFEAASREEARLDASLSFSFDDTLGYLTHCPTNLGTGMRASVMLFFPAITTCGQIESVASYLSKIGLTLRGLHGEHSSPEACMFQMSNRVTLGLSEEETLKRIKEAASRLIEQERTLRKKLLETDPTAIRDRILRSYGIFRYAEVMSSKEFLSRYADVRFGIAAGILSGIDYNTVDPLLADVMPASLICAFGERAEADKERDLLRSAVIKSALNGQQ